MIDFIDIYNGHILLMDGDKCLACSDDPVRLANVILNNGGPASTIYRSSSCDFAEMYGFMNQKEFDDLWDEVCDLL